MSQKELKFIHITKCAGTSIEMAGEKKNIEWGKNHKEYGFWHGLFPNIPPEIIEKYDWFMVVRNPYDRMLSEYHCKWGGYSNKSAMNAVARMNRFLMYKIRKRSISGDHYTEQYKYVHPEKKIHIIKFENLAEEFNNLMIEYNIEGIELEKINTCEENISNGRKLSTSDFSKDLVHLINKVYQKDFEYFNYTTR